jgi:RNA polymerase sigma factor (sigma-70 family)
MRELLATLPRAQRAVLVLRFYAGMGDDEIAETLGCAKPTIRAHAARALARLRTAIRDRDTVEVDSG